METNTIIQGDCLKVMKTFSKESIDMVLTSPPYDDLRDYEGYNFDFKNIAKELFRILKNGGVIVWVVGDKSVEGSETGTSFKQALYFKEIGFNLHDTMIYKKNGTAFPNSLRYHQCFEYMFIFSKGKPKSVNLIQDRKNSRANELNKNRWERQKNGKVKFRDKEEYTIQEIGTRWNIWTYEVGYNKTTKDKYTFEHSAMFPEKLAEDHIKSWSNEGDIVLDPMNGSGTTTKMARLLKRQYIGIDISEKYCKIANNRLRQQILI